MEEIYQESEYIEPVLLERDHLQIKSEAIEQFNLNRKMGDYTKLDIELEKAFNIFKMKNERQKPKEKSKSDSDLIVEAGKAIGRLLVTTASGILRTPFKGMIVSSLSVTIAQDSMDLNTRAALLKSFPEIVIYDLKTNKTIGPPYIEYPFMKADGMEGGQEAEQGQEEEQENGWPCKCQDSTCGCCFGMNIDRFNFSQEMCGNMVYDPIEFSMTFNMLMNGNNIYNRSMSGKNPPPMCMPIPVPMIPVQMEMCMVLFNVMQPGNNMHGCMDLEFKMQNIKMMILHFDCFRIGQNMAWLKPDENGGLDENGQIIQNNRLKLRMITSHNINRIK
uniref:CSON008971 protein n=1 Tax=Culicoides sonorensis TaxID=179676 RepID=A0A336LZK3_CULSO